MRSSPDIRQRIPVLLYHRIADTGDDRFAVSPATFVQHVERIAASGRRSLTITQLADGLRGERPLPAEAIAVTFDDGYGDTPWAVETLRQRGVSATVYIVVNTIDRAGSVTRAQLRLMGAAGEQLELGAHSVSHPRLDVLTPARVRDELNDSRRIVERYSDRRVESFAYPHGAYDAGVRAAVIEAGFRSAAAVKNAISHDLDDPFAIARFTVTGDTPARQIELVLQGAGAPLAWRNERLRTRAARSARRLRERAR